MDSLYGKVSPSVWQKAQKIKLFVCDIDGVFSDGRIYLGNNGEELKAFHTKDGYGIKALGASGVESNARFIKVKARASGLHRR